MDSCTINWANKIKINTRYLGQDGVIDGIKNALNFFSEELLIR